MRTPTKPIKHNTKGKKRKSRTVDKEVGYFGEATVNRVGAAVKQAATTAVSKTSTAVSNYKQQREARSQAAATAAATRSAQLAKETAEYERKKASYEHSLAHRRYSGPPLVKPEPPEKTLKEEWLATKEDTKKWAKRQVTPQGIVKNVKSAGKLAVKVGKGAAAETYKGMQWVEKQREQALIREKEENHRRMENWRNLPVETRRELLEEQAAKEQMGVKLRAMRQQFEDAQADKTEAMISGRKYRPKIFKISGEGGMFGDGEDKFVDEYGREVPDPGTEVFPKRRGGYGSGYGRGYGSGFVPQPQQELSQRTEMNDVEDLLGMGFRPERRQSQPQQQSQPRPERNLFSEGENQFADESEEPRRRQRRETNPRQFSQPQLPAPQQQYPSQQQQPRRNFQSDEDDELRLLRRNENAGLKLLLGY